MRTVRLSPDEVFRGVDRIVRLEEREATLLGLDGGWAYLHGGGALGTSGAVAGVETSLPAALAPLILPASPTGADLRNAIRASLAVLDLAPDRVTVPTLGAVWRLFWNRGDLERKLDNYQSYYNQHRCHTGLAGATPAQRSGVPTQPIAKFESYTWRKHCNGLFQTPTPA
jgi:hypothetical protein